MAEMGTKVLLLLIFSQISAETGELMILLVDDKLCYCMADKSMLPYCRLNLEFCANFLNP